MNSGMNSAVFAVSGRGGRGDQGRSAYWRDRRADRAVARRTKAWRVLSAANNTQRVSDVAIATRHPTVFTFVFNIIILIIFVRCRPGLSQTKAARQQSPNVVGRNAVVHRLDQVHNLSFLALWLFMLVSFPFPFYSLNDNTADTISYSSLPNDASSSQPAILYDSVVPIEEYPHPPKTNDFLFSLSHRLSTLVILMANWKYRIEHTPNQRLPVNSCRTRWKSTNLPNFNTDNTL